MTDASTQLLELREYAYRLGLVFGAEAERAETTAQRVAAYEIFNRCFFSVRVAIALDLRLRQEARRVAAPAASEGEAPEQESPEQETPEREPPEQERYDERDREVERASFPLLLRTLEGVAADAEARLPGPPPAELPALRELLARVTAASRDGPPHRSPAPTARRNHLGGSASYAASPAPSAASVPTSPPKGPARRWPTDPPG
ncbi:hypothetical protein [Phenylobacterium sp.]|uniref:hypothetical protein n=1 Tax=Phenylobacterium sp. TaxID=1871053 RepID=UPI00301E0883